MGLYLAIFDGDEELDGVEIGSYADFNDFREEIVTRLEGGKSGSRFPVLNTHSDCDGCWEEKACVLLEEELKTIKNELGRIPPKDIAEGWKADVVKLLGLKPQNMDECFFDVDGEPLTDRLIWLSQIAQRTHQAILFQ